MVNLVSKKFSKQQMKKRAFERVAWNIYHMWEETGCSDTRLLIEPLIPDSFVLHGYSDKGAERREHLVPRVMICRQAHEMFNNGHSITDVAAMIEKYLKVVLISKEEKNLLDHELRLKVTMPEGWFFENGNIDERLKVAGITYKPVSEDGL